MLRETKVDSSLNKEFTKILAYGQKVGFDKLYLDYIRKPGNKSGAMTEEAIAKRHDNDRRMKNIGIYILADYRVKNKKPTIKEILRDAIQKDKEKRKT